MSDDLLLARLTILCLAAGLGREVRVLKGFQIQSGEIRAVVSQEAAIDALVALEKPARCDGEVVGDVLRIVCGYDTMRRREDGSLLRILRGKHIQVVGAGDSVVVGADEFVRWRSEYRLWPASVAITLRPDDAHDGVGADAQFGAATPGGK